MNDSSPVNPPSQQDMTDSKRAELLHDHYKDTFEQISYHWKARNRTFMFILILLAGICIDLYQPQLLSRLANAYVQKQLAPESKENASAASVSAPSAPATPPKNQPAPGGTTVVFDTRIVSSVVWLGLLCMVISYYQRSIHVDRQYKYIEHVEDELTRLLGQPLITREGKGYFSKTGVAKSGHSEKRPLFLRAIGAFYADIFPLALVLLTLCWLWGDWHAKDFHRGFFIVNGLIGMALIASNVLYLGWKHVKK